MNIKQKGFTLVELAIVIVIIGLLVGGVLQGQELIKQAKERKIISNIESYKAAGNTFRAKYNALPGDSNKHSVFFPGVGIVEGDANGTYNLDSEVFEFWRALSVAKIIKGNFEGYQGVPSFNINSIPNDSTGSSVVYRCIGTYFTSRVYGRYLCGFWLASIKNYNLSSAGYPVMTPMDAMLFDTKYDDGKASTGKILGTRYTAVADGVCTDNNAYGSGVTTGDYLSNENLECVLIFEHNF
jgi:prepilin-type N-terminal cleavage/methylation domain-containing protein